MNTNRLVNTFCEIVRIDSPTGHESQMADYVFNKLKLFGFLVAKDAYGNVLGKRNKTSKSILLTAHLDTVEPGRGIIPTIRNGLIVSRGNTILGADNKSAVAVILEVAETVVVKKLDVNLEIVFTLSEEVGNYGAINLDYSQISSKVGFCFDAEGQVGTIISASPYYNRFDIEILGVSAHASKPELGKNALFILNNALNSIKLGRVDEDTICNIGVVEGGSVRNTIPGNIFLKGEVRSFVESKLESATKNITNAFERCARKFGAKVKIDVVRENGGYKLSLNDPIILATRRIIRSLGLNPKVMESYGVSDANIFADHGIKVVNISDGTKHSHTTKECISVKDLTKTAEIALELISKSDKETLASYFKKAK